MTTRELAVREPYCGQGVKQVAGQLAVPSLERAHHPQPVPSVEDLEGALSTGRIDGALQSCERLADEIA
jgi:hypothetical protein